MQPAESRPPLPKPKGFDPSTSNQVQQLFQDLYNFMGTDYSSAALNGFQDASAVSMTINATDKGGNGWTYTTRIVGPHVVLTPMSANLSVGQTLQFSCKVMNSDGTEEVSPTVAWSCTGPGSIDANGLYSAPATLPANAIDYVTCKYPTTGSSATATVNLAP